LRIKWLNIIYYFLYSYYSDLGKIYIKIKFSKHYNKCIYINNYYYINMSISNLVWKRLVDAQDKIKVDKKKTYKEITFLIARFS
jgi:hypothetical protein